TREALLGVRFLRLIFSELFGRGLRPGPKAAPVSAPITDLIKIRAAGDLFALEIVGQCIECARSVDPDAVMLLKIDKCAGLFVGKGGEQHCRSYPSKRHMGNFDG